MNSEDATIRNMTKDEIKELYIMLQEQRPDLLEKIFNDNSLGLNIKEKTELIQAAVDKWNEVYKGTPFTASVKL